MKKKLTITGALATVLFLLTAGTAGAAGGGGTSYCSNATKPDGVVVIGDLASYSNPGEVVSNQAPLPGAPGGGWGIQFVCNSRHFG